jgi:predicted nuclease of predicted toxin-antitoxin system
MNFLADESVDFPIIQHLRQRGFDVLAVSEEFPSKDDEYVLAKADQTDRLLITSDKDFGELVYRLKKVSAGVILLRVEELYPNEKAELLLKVIEERQAELLKSFTVIKKEMVRIRRI